MQHALRWFVSLNLDEQPWDASTFSQNRRRRFDVSGVLERLFDATVKRALAEGLVSRHVSADGTLVRANASYRSFVPVLCENSAEVGTEAGGGLRRAQDVHLATGSLSLVPGQS